MKIQKTIELREFKQFLSKNTEKLNLDVQEDLSKWLENQTNYRFTIVELGFVLDLFIPLSLIPGTKDKNKYGYPPEF